MHSKLIEHQADIVQSFNAKAKNGVTKIRELCEQHQLNFENEIADFFHAQRDNLDLEAVGDYLSAPEPESKAVLQAFTESMSFANSSVTNSLRTFLKAFQLPGEAQKIDRLVECFSEIYCQQNPGIIANKDAAYLLAFQIIMLNTDLHNPSVAAQNKMTVEQLKKNLQGCNDGQDFEPSYLKEMYQDIKTNPFEFHFVKTNPGYELHTSNAAQDPAFDNLSKSLSEHNFNIQNTFSGMGDQVKAQVNNRRSWYHDLTGYSGTITIKDDSNNSKASIQIYNPNIFSKMFFGSSSRVIIQPIYEEKEAKSKSLELAAKIASSFSTAVSHFKGTYDYEKKELEHEYNVQRKSHRVEASKNYKQALRKEVDLPGDDPESHQNLSMKF